jgi:hypothetical protein
MSVGPRSILCVVSFLCAGGFVAQGQDPVLPCSPRDVLPEDLVSDGDGGQKGETVRLVLKRLGAHCQDGKLVDQAEKEIRFVHLIGCWGNPPHDSQAQLDAQAREIQILKKRYTIVEITCARVNPRLVH